jgi:replicative DNA helicase
VTTPFDRPLPYNVDAEEATLGSLMLDPDAVKRVAFLKPDDFYREAHTWIYEAILALDAQNIPPDPLAVLDEVERRGLDIGGPATLSRLTMSIPTAIHAEYYARIVERNGALRRLIGAAESIAKLAYSEEALSLSDVRDRAERELARALSYTSTTVSHVAEAARQSTDVLLRIHDGEEPPALPMSLPTLERALGGWFRGEQTVLAANTNVGKSTLARHELLFEAQRGYHGLYISVEMYKHEVARLFKATLVGIDSSQLRHGFKKHDNDIDERTGLPRYPFRRSSKEAVERASIEADEMLAELPIHIIAPEKDPTTGRVHMPDFTPRGLRAEIRKHAERYPLAFIVVDSLPILHYPETRSSAERALIIGDASYMLREVAIETNSHNLLIHQLRPDALDARHPTHFHFEESKKIAMNADNCLILIRPSMQGDKSASVKDMEIHISKGRNERTGLLTGLHLEGATGRFSDAETRALEAQAERYATNGYQAAEVDDVIF